MRDKFGRFIKYSIPWNRNKTGIYSQNAIEKMRKAKINKHFSLGTEFKKGNKPWNEGMKSLYIHGSEKGWLKKGYKWPKEIEAKMLENLRDKVLLKPNLEMNKNLAYVLGLLKGDGCIYKNERSFRICFDNTNMTLATNFLTALKSIGLNPFLQDLAPSNGIGKQRQYRVTANSKVFYEWYKNLTLIELQKLLNGEEKIINFVRGFYEAEGSIHKQKDGTIVIQIYNTDLELLKLIKYLLEKIDLNFHLNGPYKNSGLEKNNSKPIYRIQTGKKVNVVNFLNKVKPAIKTL